MKVLGVELAPLHIPRERRLQTLVVTLYVLLFLQVLSLIGFGLLIYTFVYTRFYWLSLLYVVWYVYDMNKPHTGGRVSIWARNWTVWKYFRDFFPIELVKTADLDPKKNYIMGISPHGVMCFSAFINFGTEATGFSNKFPGLSPHLITLNGQFYSPLMREFFMMCGSCGASRDSLLHILNNKGSCEKKGQVCALLVGGARESIEAHPGRYRFVLKRRKGFVRIALETGASLVPVLSFGENDVYQTVETAKDSFIRKLQEFIKNWLQFGLPIIRGRGIFNYNFGLLPYRKPITMVIGKPIEVPKTNSPTKEQVDELHAKYVAQLVDLFNEHKHKYLQEPNTQLEIV